MIGTGGFGIRSCLLFFEVRPCLLLIEHQVDDDAGN